VQYGAVATANDCRFPIAEFRLDSSLKDNWQLPISNRQSLRVATSPVVDAGCGFDRAGNTKKSPNSSSQTSQTISVGNRLTPVLPSGTVGFIEPAAPKDLTLRLTFAST
jgi:hypothetical protein